MSEIVFVVARADNGIIGRDGTLPWRLPADLRRFKALTMGTPMVMGRKTFDSFGKPLPERRHIVLSRDAAWSAEGAERVGSVEEALALTADAPVVSVIGGAEIFRLFDDIVDRIELTEVHLRPSGDTSLPAPDPALWREDERESHAAEGEAPAFDYVTLRRRRAL